MYKKFKYQIGFLVGALIIGYYLNRTNCVSDPMCDPDPLYGGCSTTCENGSLTQWGLRSFGAYVLLYIGSFIGEEQLKDKERFKAFINRNGLRFTTKELAEEFEKEDIKSRKNLELVMRKIEEQKNKTAV